MYCRIDSWIRAYLCVKFGEDHTWTATYVECEHPQTNKKSIMIEG